MLASTDSKQQDDSMADFSLHLTWDIIWLPAWVFVSSQWQYATWNCNLNKPLSASSVEVAFCQGIAPQQRTESRANAFTVTSEREKSKLQFSANHNGFCDFSNELASFKRNLETCYKMNDYWRNEEKSNTTYNEQ